MIKCLTHFSFRFQRFLSFSINLSVASLSAFQVNAAAPPRPPSQTARNPISSTASCAFARPRLRRSVLHAFSAALNVMPRAGRATDSRPHRQAGSFATIYRFDIRLLFFWLFLISSGFREPHRLPVFALSLKHRVPDNDFCKSKPQRRQKKAPFFAICA